MQKVGVANHVNLCAQLTDHYYEKKKGEDH